MAEITLLARAEGDILRIYAERESRAVGGGDAFSHEVEKTLALLSRMPRLGRFVGPPYRRMKLSRFPYSVIYCVEGARVMIQAVVSNHDSLDTILHQLRR
jgi:plasmid stabilization system protein ParE